MCAVSRVGMDLSVPTASADRLSIFVLRVDAVVAPSVPRHCGYHILHGFEICGSAFPRQHCPQT